VAGHGPAEGGQARHRRSVGGPVACRAVVDAAIFDIGGVLLDWDPRHLYERLIPDRAELDRFLGEICTLEWNGTFDAGTPFDEGCRELAERHPEHAELIHAWKRQDEMVRGEVEGIRPIVERLHGEGVPLYLLTNMPADVFEERRRTFDLFGLFGGAVVSGAERVCKPDRRIFELAAERFGVEPARTVYVDDAERNVVAAAEVGFLAHRFTSAAALDEWLRALP
jgi:2-haloacid dehalogenase